MFTLPQIALRLRLSPLSIDQIQRSDDEPLLVARRTLPAIAASILAWLIVFGAAYAEDPDAEPTPFEFLLTALADANDHGILTGAISEALADMLIEYLIAPETGESPEEVRVRLTVQGQSAFQLLMAVLRDANYKGALPDVLSDLVSELVIERLIAPHTGETSEMVADRLRERRAQSPTQGSVPAWEWEWVKDGISESERVGIKHLRSLQALSERGFEELVRKDWVQDDLIWLEAYVIRYLSKIAEAQNPGADELIVEILRMPFLDRVEIADAHAMRVLSQIHLRNPGGLTQFLSDPRLMGGITDATTGIVILAELEEENPEAAEVMWAVPWIADGLVEEEALLISGIVELAINSPPLGEIATEFADHYSGDLVLYLVDSLYRFESAPSQFEALAAQPWFTDGLTVKEVALVAVLGTVALVNPDLFHVLLQDHYIQSRVADLPLAGKVNIWVVQPFSFPPGDDSSAVIEDTARITEEFLGAPFPTTDVILLILDAHSTEHSIALGHYRTFMILDRFDGEVYYIPHETAHYYFHGNFSLWWFVEGAAEFVEAYFNHIKGSRDLADRRAEMAVWVQQDCVNDGIENIRHTEYLRMYVYPDRIYLPGLCTYQMGENFFLQTFETIGGEAMSSALRELYLPNREFIRTGDAREPPTEEEIYEVFLKHTPADRKEAFRDLYRRLHGGAVAFPDIDYSDDHGDEAPSATSIEVGVPVEGALDYIFDFDYFRFDAEQDGKYRINVGHSALRYRSVNLYGPDGLSSERRRWLSRWNTGSGPETLWVAPGSGEYYFAVQNFGGMEGSYTLSIDRIEDRMDDHGDTIATASDLVLSQALNGRVDDYFDLDFFKFRASEGSGYRIDIHGHSLDIFRLRLHASDGTVLNNWDWDYHSSAGRSFRANASLDWTAMSSGEYFIAIYDVFGGGGAYSLTISEIDDDAAEAEQTTGVAEVRGGCPPVCSGNSIIYENPEMMPR